MRTFNKRKEMGKVCEDSGGGKGGLLFPPILIQLFHHYDPLLQYLPTCLLHTFDTLCRVLTLTKAADMESLGGEVSVFLVPTELPYYSLVFKSCTAHRFLPVSR